MPDFLERFADNRDPQTGERSFSNWKSGLIVALVSFVAILSNQWFTHELTAVV